MNSSTTLRGHVDALVVGGDLLIAAGWVEAGRDQALKARLFSGERELALHEAEIVRTTRAGAAAAPDGDASGPGFFLIGELGDEPGSGELALALSSSGLEARLDCPTAGTLPALLETIAAATPRERHQIRRALERRMSKLAQRGETLPRPEQLHPDLRAHVDRACLIPGRGVYVYGWILDPESRLQSVELGSEGPASPNLLEHAARHPRPDVAKAFPGEPAAGLRPGLVAFVELDVDARPEVGELLFVTRAGETAMLAFPIEDPTGGLVEQLELILSPFRPEDPDAVQVLEAHVGPAIEGRWRARPRAPKQAPEHRFGPRPVDPACSIVVPLFARYDFLMYQLSLFARDPEISKMDLIYVLDDERIREDTLRLARDVAPLWPVPFRILDLGQNLGYAGANNAGARAAEGEYLLLLNSDVVPDRAGWLGRLCDKHQSLPRCGALAPRLLFEDGSIQHDGIHFVRHPDVPEIWLNDHPGKGRRPRPEDAEDVAVPAVTGACMLVRRDTYLDLGGLDEGYVIGDFEDSDLCLRLRERGELSYCARTETLYHLERQSVRHVGRLDWRTKVTLYNAWRHTRRWRSTLEELADDA